MIVVDIGCAAQPPEESVYTLADRFKPEFLYGFDPLLELPPGVKDGYAETYNGTHIACLAAAAWLYDGKVPIVSDGIRTGVHDTGHEAWCIDFPSWLAPIASGGVVVKFDCEGAEYPLLHAIHNLGLDQQLELVIVEWHEGLDPHGPHPSHGWHVMGRPALRCPVEEW